MDNDSRALTTDDLLRLAASRTRRIVLQCLREREDGRIRVDELASTVAARRKPTVSGQPASQATIRARLHHRHLPRLAAAGVVEYEEERCTVQYHPHERLELLLDFLDEEFA